MPTPGLSRILDDPLPPPRIIGTPIFTPASCLREPDPTVIP